ncbi:MAG: hypothetical protein U9N36_01975 [Euryarchaeota archaeon]|nr:hypothetical protein [Euryarchaeota archaeon]
MLNWGWKSVVQGSLFSFLDLGCHTAITPAAACRIMKASSDVMRPSPLTSAAANVAGSHEAEPPAASWSAIAASAGVIRPSPLRSHFFDVSPTHGCISGKRSVLLPPGIG